MILKSLIYIEYQYVMNIFYIYCGKIKITYYNILIFIICKLLKKNRPN